MVQKIFASKLSKLILSRGSSPRLLLRVSRRIFMLTSPFSGMGVMGCHGLAAISALTLTMIPGVVSQDLVTNTTYRDRQPKVIGIIEKNARLGFWIQFFLLFAMPFVDGPSTIMNETQYDMHRITIEEAHSKGFF